jgi:hypothetical protein
MSDNGSCYKSFFRRARKRLSLKQANHALYAQDHDGFSATRRPHGSIGSKPPISRPGMAGETTSTLGATQDYEATPSASARLSFLQRAFAFMLLVAFNRLPPGTRGSPGMNKVPARVNSDNWSVRPLGRASAGCGRNPPCSNGHRPRLRAGCSRQFQAGRAARPV